MRRLLRALAGGWLVCQLIAVASPLALACDSFGIDQASCCPGIGPGQVCPMHHKTAADRTTCKMESACGHGDAALLTIVGVGVLPPVSAAIVSAPIAESIAAIVLSPLSRAAVPDLPPPRSHV